MKTKSSIRLALIVFITILSAFTVRTSMAQAGPYTLTMTELSNLQLSYSWNGPNPVTGTATATTPDHWTFNIVPDNVIDNLGGSGNENVYWKEPDYATSGRVNLVNIFTQNGNGSTITVTSDTTQSQGYPLAEDFAPFNFYTDDGHISGGNTVQFNDPFVDEPVPEGGSSWFLLFISAALLVALRQRFAGRRLTAQGAS